MGLIDRPPSQPPALTAPDIEPDRPTGLIVCRAATTNSGPALMTTRTVPPRGRAHLGTLRVEAKAENLHRR